MTDHRHILKSRVGKAAPVLTAGLGLVVFVSGTIPGMAHNNQVQITEQGGQRCIVSNGLPDHSTGSFPNRGNPHRISEQNIRLCVPKNPRKSSRATPVRGSIGVAINGVQFRPGTADWYDPSSRRGHSRNPSSGWNLEGLGARQLLGMDRNNAHVDQRGLYHYHGVAGALTRSAKGSLIGYAADGFEIHYVGKKQTSSYQLKKGTRPSGPGGRYDGTYNQDWAYVAGSGTLDRCNGGKLNGKFVYFATDSYPFFPRCLWGQISSDFRQGPGHGLGQRTGRGPAQGPRQGGQPPYGQHAGSGRPDGSSFFGRIFDRGSSSGHGLRQHGHEGQQQYAVRGQGRFGPPQEALKACSNKQEGTGCRFTAPGGRTISGSCGITPDRQTACIPQGHRHR